MDEMLCNNIAVFFNRLGTWFLTDMSLANYCCNRDITNGCIITIGMLGIEPATIEEKCRLFDVPFEKTEYENKIGVRISGITVHVSLFQPSRKGWLECNGIQIRPEWVQCSPDVKDELKRKRSEYIGNDCLWTIPMSQMYPQTFNVPYMVGTLLDATVPKWFGRVKHPDVTKWENWNIHDLFFDEPRRKNGYELLQKLYECGRSSGIADNMFVGFGTLLGIIRHGSFLAHDRDMDMCIVADGTNPEMAMLYAKTCDETGLGECRWRPPELRPDTGMPLWFSLGPKNPVTDSGVKCCQWFWFKYGGYWWHTKGGQWVNPNKFSHNKTAYTANDVAICKGIPEDCIEALMPYNFNGTMVNIPTTPGRCLDNWYPGWPVPDTKASAHTYIMVIGDWGNKDTWRIG